MQTPKKPISKTSRGVRPVRSASKMPKIGKAYKFEDGGKVTGADIRNAKKQAKLQRIQSGTEPSTYEKVSNISGNVARTAASAAQVANAVRDTRSGMTGPGGMKKGGTVKKYQGGGRVISEKAAARKSAKGKGRIGYKYGPNTDSPGTGNNKGSYVGFSREARKSDGPFKSMKDSKPARPIMKKGGAKKK